MSAHNTLGWAWKPPSLLTAMRPRMQRLLLREVLAHLTTHATITLAQVLELHAALHPIHGKPEIVKVIQARNVGGFTSV